MADDEHPSEQSDDPQATWPPRFTTAFVGWAAVVLLLLFLSMAGWFRSVWDSAALFTGDDAASQAVAYVLSIVGLLLLLAGVLFALIEARKPPPATAQEIELAENGLDLPAFTGQLLNAIEKHETSRVLLALGVALLVVAAAGSGLVSISVGGQDGTSDAAPAATATPTPE